MEADNFIAFLPGDNSDLSSASTQTVLEIINDDLAHLLRLPPAQFWQVVVTDKSLHSCLDSFLRFKRSVAQQMKPCILTPADAHNQTGCRHLQLKLQHLIHASDAAVHMLLLPAGVATTKAKALSRALLTCCCSCRSGCFECSGACEQQAQRHCLAATYQTLHTATEHFTDISNMLFSVLLLPTTI